MLVAGYCTLCRSRCGSVNEIQDGRLVKVSPLQGHPTGGALCAKGRAAPELVASPLRITRPLRRTAPRDAADPRWQEISWDEALDEIAGRLLGAKAQGGAESVAFAVTTPSGTPMVDSFEWVERFIRGYGSPNLLYAVEICGWHKDYAHALTFGRGIGVPDLEAAEVVILWGHNPARTWLAQASRVGSARQRGAKVVVVDPKQDGSGQQADLWMPVRPGADGALAMGAIRHLLATESFDADFVRQWTNASLLVDTETGKLLRADELWHTGSPAAHVVIGETGDPEPRGSEELGEAESAQLFAEGECRDARGLQRRYASVLTLLRQQAEAYTPGHVAATTWIEPGLVEQFNALFMHSPKLAYHAWTGVGQHTNATQTERAIATLYALTGACDKEGGNLWTSAPPYRLVNEYTSLLPKEQRDKALGLAELPLGPPRLGWITARDLCKAVLEGHPYKVGTLISFGTNLLVTQADTERNRRMLHALDFHVHADVFMNPTAESADIVLPANLPWERDALKCGFEISQAAVEHVQLRQRMVHPPGEARADYEIVMALAQRMGMADDFFGGDIEAGWNYQLEPLGVTVNDLRRRPEGMNFPQPTTRRKYAGQKADGTVTGFATPSRRVELYSEALLGIGQSPLATFIEPSEHPQTSSDFPIVLTTAKSGWFVHSSHRHVASLRRKAPSPQVQISAEHANAIGAHDGEWVKLVTPHGAVRMKAQVSPTLNAKVAIADFGWWQNCEPLGRSSTRISGPSSSNINSVLSDARRDPISGSVPLRATICRVEADPQANRGHWPGTRAFRISAKHRVAEDIEQFDFTPEDGQALPSFLPGQHVVVSSPALDVRRAYSLVGPNLNPQSLSVAVRLARASNQPDGRMSSHLHGLPVGAAVQLTQPSGVFSIPTQTDRPLVFVAGGIGITPFLGHLRALMQLRDAGQRTPTVMLVFSGRRGAPHPFESELQRLALAIGTVSIDCVFGPDAPSFDFLTADLMAKKPLAYLCGSPGFLDAMREVLRQAGIPNFDIFDETFSAEVEIPQTLGPQKVCIAEADTSFDWSPAMGTLLDAADRAGVALPSGCRVGQCESCVMTLVEGKVVHLTAWDGPSDRCLTCMSVPLTPVVLRR
ncbi:molybdopterin-dependent oxidoreductase [Comamonas sp. BIGb0124]|uniref:molybdopterin-dependent oxidoreductase n=1 Tax=Comamonas sp. BIGb0124 TaxID=2485130 RepID=UPI000F460A1D|nr:molybdopterin-dependent oxidoreductase [Comamonas sp. BIGb0124]